MKNSYKNSIYNNAKIDHAMKKLKSTDIQSKPLKCESDHANRANHVLTLCQIATDTPQLKLGIRNATPRHYSATLRYKCINLVPSPLHKEDNVKEEFLF